MFPVYAENTRRFKFSTHIVLTGINFNPIMDK